MKPIPIFRGECRNGKLVLGENFEDYLRSIDGPVEVFVRKPRLKRSLAANRYYRGVVLGPLARYCGYTDRELHQILKRLFLSVEGETPRSTASLSREEFAEFIENVIRLAGEVGFVIPPPEIVEV